MTTPTPASTRPDRPLPTVPDAERAVLGSILLNRDAIVAIAAWLTPDAFAVERHAWIYAAMLDCFAHGTPPDTQLVMAALAQRNRLDAVGGVLYLAELVDAVPTSYHIAHYAELVATAAFNRQLVLAGGRIAAHGYANAARDVALASAQGELDSLAHQRRKDDGLVPVGETITQRWQAIAEATARGEVLQRGIPTGFRDLDALLGGLQPTDLILLGARPSVGKSSFALSLAAAASARGARGGLFSLEMSRAQCVDRLIAIDTGLEMPKIRQGTMTVDELTTYSQACARIDGLPLAIDDHAALAVADVRARALRYATQFGALDYLIIDYLQLMGSVKRAENRVQEISAISLGLKQLAKELGCPILALSQLSRAVEGRTSHVPMLSDLRESGSLEQDADIVLFLYREELYERDTDKKGIAELHIAKHRNGPTGMVPLRFDARTTRFSDLSYRTAEGY